VQNANNFVEDAMESILAWNTKERTAFQRWLQNAMNIVAQKYFRGRGGSRGSTSVSRRSAAPYTSGAALSGLSQSPCRAGGKPRRTDQRIRGYRPAWTTSRPDSLVP
jgi:hypothetical protein